MRSTTLASRPSTIVPLPTDPETATSTSPSARASRGTRAISSSIRRLLDARRRRCARRVSSSMPSDACVLAPASCFSLNIEMPLRRTAVDTHQQPARRERRGWTAASAPSPAPASASASASADAAEPRREDASAPNGRAEPRDPELADGHAVCCACARARAARTARTRRRARRRPGRGEERQERLAHLHAAPGEAGVAAWGPPRDRPEGASRPDSRRSIDPERRIVRIVRLGALRVLDRARVERRDREALRRGSARGENVEPGHDRGWRLCARASSIKSKPRSRRRSPSEATRRSPGGRRRFAANTPKGSALEPPHLLSERPAMPARARASSRTAFARRREPRRRASWLEPTYVARGR